MGCTYCAAILFKENKVVILQERNNLLSDATEIKLKDFILLKKSFSNDTPQTKTTKKANLIMLLDAFETSLQPRALHRLAHSSQPYIEKIKVPTYLSIKNIAKPEGLNSN